MKNFALLLIALIAAQPSFAQWKPCNTNLFGGVVSSIYAKSPVIFAGTKAGAFRSTDNGATWSITSVTRETVNSFAANGDTIYAGTTDGIYRSTDNGVNWTHAAVGPFDNVVNSLIINGKLIYAGTTNGAFVSTDNGVTWVPRNAGLGAIPNLTALAAKDNSIFAGVKDKGMFVSTDNGSNWTPVGSINYRINTIVTGGENLYAGTSNGVYVSTDGGAVWTRKINGLNELFIFTIAANGNYVFLGANDGVYLTTDLGETWRRTDMNWEAASSLTFGGNALYVGGNEVVHNSTDFGSSWKKGSVNPTNNFIYSFVQRGADIYLASYNGVFISGDNCSTWTPKKVGLTDSVVRGIGVNEHYILAYTVHDSVFYSTNDGEYWTATKKILPFEYPGVQYINGITMDENYIYAATTDGVYTSSDRGDTWVKKSVGVSPEEATALALDGSNIYAAIRNYGLYRSTDNGNTWTLKNNGLTSVNINTITVYGAKIGVGTNEGIFLSTNNGESWTQYNEGMINPISTTLAVVGNSLISGSNLGINLSKTGGLKWFEANEGLVYRIIKGIAVKGDDVYVGTYGGGVFQAKLSDFQDISAPEPRTAIDGIWLYPNPVNDFLNVSYKASQENSIQILDVLGNLILTTPASGSGSNTVDVRALPAGSYWARIGQNVKIFVKN